jgi:hypothetical protein
MKIIIIMFLIFIAIILAIICLVGVITGIDLKKRSNWLFVLCGFLLGVLMGLSNGDFSAAVGFGFGAAITVAYSGEMVRRHKTMFTPPSKPSRKKRNSYK